MSVPPGIDYRWLRRLRLPFTGLGSDGRTTAYEANGKGDGLYITARVQKNIHGLATPSQIMVYNLSPESRAAFRRGDTKVTLEAGWDHGPGAGLKLCFRGSLMTAVHARAGGEIATTVNASSMLQALAKTEIHGTWRTGIPVQMIVRELAMLLPDVEFDPSLLTGIDRYVVGFKGWSCSGLVIDGLDQLAREFGFSWTVIDGKFMAAGDQDSFGVCAIIREPYLIDVNPILSGPLQIATGIKARCALETALMPMWRVGIESTVNAKYNGDDYRIVSVVHNLNCQAANGFISEVTAFMPPSAERSL